MPRVYDVITVGNVRMDAYMSIHSPKTELHSDHTHKDMCFRLGSKVLVDKYDFLMGGNAANVAVGLSRLGVKTTLAAEMGDDEFSIKIRNTLARENIERLFISEKKNTTTNLSVIINFAGDRTVFAEERVQENDFDLHEAETSWVYLTSLGNHWQEAYEKVLKYVDEQKCKLAFNPGSLQLKEGLEVVHKVLKKTDILFVNKEEAELILFNHYKLKIENSEKYIHELCLSLRKQGVRNVVITNGKNGSYVLTEEKEFYEQGLIHGEVIERTGAGDGFASGLLAAIIHEKDIKTAMLWGSHNAAGVVGAVGAEDGLLKLEEMKERVGNKSTN